jgi:hypothetical protein
MQILTTADDTTTTLGPTFESKLMATGTGIMQVYDLGDATMYGVGKAYVIFNSTPEFIGVKNSDNTVWHRVPPRATFTAYLVDNSTAAGVWESSVYDSAVGDPAMGLDRTLDFVEYTASTNYIGSLSVQPRVAGAAAAANPLAITAGGRQGFVGLTTGTTAAGYSLIEGPDSVSMPVQNNVLGAGCRAVEASLSLSAISAPAEEYIFRFGIGDNITGGAHTEGGYFLYDRAGLGTTLRLKSIKTAGGAANTVTDTGVQPIYGTTGAEWQKYRLEISSSGARLDGWLDNVLVSPAGGQGNLPAVTTGIKLVNGGITKSVGTTARYVKADYVRIQSYPTVLR